MPINLRYDLRFRFDRTLARRLEVAWRKIGRMGEMTVKPTWWDAFHANRMKRSFIRHRLMYRIKARVHVAFTHAAAIVEGGGGAGEGVLIFLPFYVLAWLIAPRPFPRPPEVLGEYDAFLLRCEIEDLQDEIQRRIDRRRRKQVT
jgi:hypothetical protein